MSVYLQHFGLVAAPFTLTPNRALFFPDAHQPVLDALMHAVGRGDGVLKVVGEVGTGKTLLCRLLLASLEATEAVALITAPRTDPGAIAAEVCREFGLPLYPGEDPFTLLPRFLVEVNRRNRRTILVVDEAQALGPAGLEAIRLLTNFETDDAKLLQVVLFGQPELDQLLHRHDMRQLAQRVAFGLRTKPFTPAQSVAYLRHRVAGSALEPERAIFTERAEKALARASGGTARILNLLADRALLAAYGEGAPVVSKRHVAAGLEDEMLWRPHRGSWGLRSWRMRLFGHPVA